MNGDTLATFATEVNGGDAIGSTMLYQLLNLAKGLIEQRRPWMLLRRTDTSKTVAATSASAWQTAIDLSTIANFNRFHDADESCAIKLFDGNQTYTKYRQVPFEKRLQYIQRPGTFVYNENTQQLYLNGNIPFAGTLYIDHVVDSPDIAADTSWIFPSWSHPLLAFYAVAINKGGIDFDDIHARMAPDNRAQAALILQQLEMQDNTKQLQAQQSVDPYEQSNDTFRPGSINIS